MATLEFVTDLNAVEMILLNLDQIAIARPLKNQHNQITGCTVKLMNGNSFDLRETLEQLQNLAAP